MNIFLIASSCRLVIVSMQLKNYSFIFFKVALVRSCRSLSFVYQDVIAHAVKTAGLLHQQTALAKTKISLVNWSRNIYAVTPTLLFTLLCAGN